MNNIFNIMKDIIPWAFSGVGVFILGLFILKAINKKKSLKQIIDNHSVGIQAGRDVKIEKEKK